MSLDGRDAFLEYLKVASFGALSQRTIGPFGSGLNVVFGPNESGKTTLFSFVEGVLFGWRDARGTRNTYKAQGAERAGSLVFASKGGAEGAQAELFRGRNADGLQGDAALVEDIDPATYRTVFALTSDELRSLRHTTDVTAKLLTAGSGTGTTPAVALEALQGQLAEHTSRAQGASCSIPRLAAEADEVRRAMDEAAAEMEGFREHHRELARIEPEQATMNARMDESHRQVEAAQAALSGIDRLDAERRSLAVELDSLHAEERAALASRDQHEATVGHRLASMSSAEDAVVRERLDALATREAKQAHAQELAQHNLRNSQAAFDALQEAQASDDPHARRRAQRTTKVGIAALLAVSFLLAGVPLFMYGRSLPSLSYMVLGAVLVLVALILAGATLGMLLRPSRRDDAYEARLQDAGWVLLQDQKKLAACEADAVRLRSEVRAELDSLGLEAAQGQLRRARVLLDEAKDARSAMALEAQRQQAATLRANQAEERLAVIADERAALCERAGAPIDADAASLEALTDRRIRDRASLQEASDALNRRIGELSQELAQAQGAQGFDQLKMRHQELLTRVTDAKVSYARLLLARSMLEAAIASWESKSQPEVYQRAGQLLALMTGGRWVQVRLTEEGSLEAVDGARTARDPRQLSLGTCQQLYLALRIALLESATNVGRAVPVLADDILVHFDAERRAAAAQALAELARSRQVILFTCHEEVVSELSAAEPRTTVIRL